MGFSIMARRLTSGVKVVKESEGTGRAATKGDTVEFDSQGFLSRGQCVQQRLTTTSRIGDRRLIAGLECSLIGMRPGGYRKVRISPHLAYRDEGVPVAEIPANAVLIYELWMTRVEKPLDKPTDPRASEHF